MRLLFYLMLGAIAVLLIRLILVPSDKKSDQKQKLGKKLKNRVGREVWVQVYDTASLEEVQSLQARLEEQELDCLVYEQGRKDVHGNPLKGYGIVVPRTSVSRAQKIIVQTPS